MVLTSYAKVRGYVAYVVLRGDQARMFGHKYNNGWYLPEDLDIDGESVKIRLIDPELPGVGVHVLCRTHDMCNRLTQELHTYSQYLTDLVPSLRSPKTLGESFLGV
jgi:hypothetical protein